MLIPFISYLDAIHPLISQCTLLPTKTCLFSILSASLLHPLNNWFAVSRLSLKILLLHCSWHLSMYALIAFVRNACSCAVRTRDSVSLFKLPCFSHSNLVSPAISSVCLKNYPCGAFLSNFPSFIFSDQLLAHELHHFPWLQVSLAVVQHYSLHIFVIKLLQY